MPCRDPGYEECLQSDLVKANKTVENLQNKIDKLTRMLCETLGWMESNLEGRHLNGTDEQYGLTIPSKFFNEHSEITSWWKEHRQFDYARRAAEKLSKEEQVALFEYIKKHRKLP